MAKNWLQYKLSQENYNPVSVRDVLTNKREKAHTEAYENAKWQAILNYTDEDNNLVFMDEYDPSKTNYDDDTIFISEDKEICEEKDAKYYVTPGKWKFSEYESVDYKYAPKMLCVKRRLYNEVGNPSAERHLISLAPWWNMVYASASELKYDDFVTNTMVDKYPYNEIVAFDYINEKITIENRVEMEKRKIPFQFIKYNDKLNINYKDNY